MIYGDPELQLWISTIIYGDPQFIYGYPQIICGSPQLFMDIHKCNCGYPQILHKVPNGVPYLSAPKSIARSNPFHVKEYTLYHLYCVI